MGRWSRAESGVAICVMAVLPRFHQASLDQPTQTVVMHRTEPTAQQNLALQLAEKLGSLVENNERVFDHKQGTYGGYFRGPWFCPSVLPRSRPPSRLFAVIHGLLPSPLPCRPEGRLPQERGLHAPGRLPPAAVSDGLLMAPLPRSRPLGRGPRPELLKFCSESLQCVLICMAPQRWVGHGRLRLLFLSFCHMVGPGLKMRRGLGRIPDLSKPAAL